MNALKRTKPSEVPVDPDRDAELFTQDDLAAFNRLIKRSRGVFTHIVGLCTNHDRDGEDLVSIVEFLLWSKRKEFVGTYEDFLQWGTFILRYSVKDWRKARIRARKHEEIVEVVEEVPVPAEADSPAWEYRQDLPDVAWGMSQLPKRTVTVIQRRLDDETWEDIADELSLSIARVREIHAEGIEFLLRCVTTRRRQRGERSVLRANSGTQRIDPAHRRPR